MSEFYLGALIGSLATIAMTFTIALVAIVMVGKDRNYPNAVRSPKRER